MSDCTCDRPGWCEPRGRVVTGVGHRICRRGDPASVAAYFGGGPAERPPRPARAPLPVVEATARRGPCVHLGAPVVGADGRQATRACGPCGGKVRLKVYECRHPGHAADPTTVLGERDGCSVCRDYEARGEEAMGQPATKMGTMPVRMVIPSDRRPQIFRGGVLQIMVTRACDLACHGCSAGSNLVSKPAVMTPEQFDEACASLEGFFGVVGVFGGNPATSRYFGDYCRIMRARFPLEQRGLWCNNLMGQGAHAQITFDPKVSNVNVHLSRDAYDEFARDWPEALEARREHVERGLREDSRHGSPWVAMADLESLPFPDGSARDNTEDNRWQLIKDCPINKNWSAMICLVRGELRGFACEIMGHMAALHGDNPDWAGTGAPMPDVGLAVEPGWWRRPLADFERQFRTCCHNCSVPLNRPGQLAIGGQREEFSERHRFLARPKVRDRVVSFVSAEALERRDRPATEYLSGVTPGYKGG
jgi:hypothetical protein